jgi:hypothetical protein
MVTLWSRADRASRSGETAAPWLEFLFSGAAFESSSRRAVQAASSVHAIVGRVFV